LNSEQTSYFMSLTSSIEHRVECHKDIWFHHTNSFYLAGTGLGYIVKFMIQAYHLLLHPVASPWTFHFNFAFLCLLFCRLNLTFLRFSEIWTLVISL
jgi:hypothetical protein